MIRPDVILLPEESTDMHRFAVVACDQFTQDSLYWQQAEGLARGVFSAYHMMLPEIYLNKAESLTPGIHQYMQNALSGNRFRQITGMVYIERTLKSGAVRKGLVAAVDLEAYNYLPGSASPVRATEKTILERLPPRMDIRRGAPLEMPHIQLLLNDAAFSVIEPLANMGLPLLYNTPLMLGGGHIKGFLVGAKACEDLLARFRALAEKAGLGGIVLAVGDGNHSLATAKACWEELKKTLSEEEQKNHPQRYALTEIMNLYDPALAFLPIHRTVFRANPAKLLAALTEKLALTQAPAPQSFIYVENGQKTRYYIHKPTHFLALGSVQGALDEIAAENPEMETDYIHEEETVLSLSEKGAAGLLFDTLDKYALFPAVQKEGSLPRKTFSMGEGHDKRYYIEARRIKPD